MGYASAISTYRHILHKQPRCLHASLQLGRMLHGLQRNREALDAYQLAASAAEQIATQHHVHGLSLACQHQLQEATTAFTAAMQLEPDNIAHNHALGSTWLQLHQPRQALQAYDAVLTYHPDDPVALTYSHDALDALGQGSEAQQRIARALEVDSKNVPAIARQVQDRINRGLLNGKDGRDTANLLRRALGLAPHAPDLQALVARVHGTDVSAAIA